MGVRAQMDVREGACSDRILAWENMFNACIIILSSTPDSFGATRFRGENSYIEFVYIHSKNKN